MTRGIGEAELVNQLPDVVIAVAGIVTQFGDMWFVLLGIVAVYWLGIRGSIPTDDPLRDCLFLLALTIGSYSLTVVLKHAFTLPRPPGAGVTMSPIWLPPIAAPIYESMVTADGFGFPSGHALKSATVYGGAALVLELRDRRRRVLFAGTTVALIASSRVLLGVHYVVDVIVGTVVGLAFLGLVTRTAKNDPRRALAVAVAFGVVAVAMTTGFKAGLAAGTAAIALGIWEFAGETTLEEAI